MAETTKTEYLRPDYIRFGRDERRLAEILNKKQQDQKFYKKKKEEEASNKEEPEKSDFVDRSAQLSASLNSLALSNMIKLKKLERNSRSRIDTFIDEEAGQKVEILNPFVKKIEDK